MTLELEIDLIFLFPCLSHFPESLELAKNPYFLVGRSWHFLPNSFQSKIILVTIKSKSILRLLDNLSLQINLPVKVKKKILR